MQSHLQSDSATHRVATALVLLGWALLVARFWFVTDDAFISFRYAANFAEGHGLRYNLGPDAPVEGYSNLLWVLWAALLHGLRLSLPLAMPLTAAVCGLVLLLRVGRVARRNLGLRPGQALFALAFLALSPSFAVWSSSGLETMPFALAVFLLFEAVVLAEAPRGGRAICCGAAILALRPEGFLWLLGALACMGFTRQRPHPNVVRSALWLLAGWTAVFGALVLWRLAYYGSPLPMTVIAKADLSWAALGRGFGYVAVYFLTFLPSFLILPAAIQALVQRQARGRWLAITVFGVAPIAYAIGVGGDFMTMGRFLIPGLPFLALLVARLPDALGAVGRSSALTTTAGALILAVGLAPGFDLHLVPRAARARFHFRHNSPAFRSEFQQWEFMRENSRRYARLGRALRARSQPGDSIVVGAIGALGFYSGLTIYDRFGLVSPEVAGQPPSDTLRSPGHDKAVAAEFFLPHRPTFLEARYFTKEDGRGAAEQQLRGWQQRSRIPGYAPRLFAIGEPEPGWVVVVMRTEPVAP